MVDSTGLEPVFRVSGPVLPCFAVIFCAVGAVYCAVWCSVGFGRAFAVRLKIRLNLHGAFVKMMSPAYIKSRIDILRLKKHSSTMLNFDHTLSQNK